MTDINGITDKTMQERKKKKTMKFYIFDFKDVQKW